MGDFLILKPQRSLIHASKVRKVNHPLYHLRRPSISYTPSNGILLVPNQSWDTRTATPYLQAGHWDAEASRYGSTKPNPTAVRSWRWGLPGKRRLLLLSMSTLDSRGGERYGLRILIVKFPKNRCMARLPKWISSSRDQTPSTLIFWNLRILLGSNPVTR